MIKDLKDFVNKLIWLKYFTMISGKLLTSHKTD